MIRRIGYGLLAGLILSGCGGGGGSDYVEPNDNNAPPVTEPGNTVPVADAGSNQNVKVGDTVKLDGTASNDEDGDSLTYHWEMATKSESNSTTLERADTPKPRFQADAAGEYIVTLVVNDGQADSEPASVKVTATVQNSPPVADAGADQNVATGDSVKLDGRNSSDADGDSLSYQWSLAEKPSGSVGALQDADTVEPSFTPDRDGEYRLALIVNDGLTDSAADEVVVTATTANSVPVADAGDDQNVTEGDTVTLDGSTSRDADGDPLSYAWRFVSRPAGSGATLTDTDTARPDFQPDVAGDYVVELIVNDGEADSTPDNVAVSVAEANSVPVADAGDDQTVVAGDTVTLDGQNSQDADGDRLTYQWQFVSKPDGSLAQLDGTDTVTPTFQADIQGSYVVSLIVSDDEDDSESVRVTITASERNAAPVAKAGDDQDVVEGDTVRLDGSASSDANDDEISYQWRFTSRPSGSAAALTDTAAAAPEFTADEAGTYVLELVVNDGELDSASDNVTIEADEANVRPTADAGPDQSITVGDTIELDGSASSDPNGDSLTYAWRVITAPVGSTVGNSDDLDTVSPTFNPDIGGDYVFALVVNDGELDSSEDVVAVSVSPSFEDRTPIADAGADQNVMTGTTVYLNGSESESGEEISPLYEWTFVSKPEDSSASLVSAASEIASFTPDVDGDYVLELVVENAYENTDSDRITVTSETDNSAPVADAGEDQTLYLGGEAVLDANGSSDADGDPLTYYWRTVSAPEDSDFDFNGQAPAYNSWTPDAVGDYVLKLMVSDGEKDSEEDTVTITVLEPTLKFETYSGIGFGDPEWRDSSLPYSSNSEDSRSCTGSCPSTIELGRYRLTAEGQDFTVTNVQITNVGGSDYPTGLNPRFASMSSGETISDGITKEFKLLVDAVPGTATVEFSFEIEETGDQFQSTYTLTLR